MKSIILLLLAIFLSYGVKGQNLVPNPSFENYEVCPWGFSDLEGFVEDWMSTDVLGWQGTPDYYNACDDDNCNVSVPYNRSSDYAPAHSGVAYAGLLTLYNPGDTRREYIAVELTEPLVSGVAYNVSAFVQRIEGAAYNTPVSLHLSEDFLEQTSGNNIDIEPNVLESEIIADTTWQEISANYEAQGGERYLTIGNFRDDLETPIEQPGAFPVECSSLFKVGAAYYFIDDVSVSTSLNTNFPLGSNGGFTAYPNPCKDNFTIELKSEDLPAELEILDSMGQLIQKMRLTNKKTNISVHSFPSSSLLLRLKVGSGNSLNQRLMIMK